MGLFLSSLIPIVVMFFLGTAGANFLVQTIRPNWSRRKHILWSSMLPPLGLWLLVNFVVVISGSADGIDGFEVLIPLIASAIMFPFVGALIGIPTSWLILKQMNWKKSDPLDDIFE